MKGLPLFLARTLVAGFDATPDEVRRYLPEGVRDALLELGILETAGENLRSTVLLLPGYGFYVAADRGPPARAGVPGAGLRDVRGGEPVAAVCGDVREVAMREFAGVGDGGRFRGAGGEPVCGPGDGDRYWRLGRRRMRGSTAR